MNIFEVLKSGESILKENNVQDYDFDALCLLEETFNFTRNDYYLNRLNEADKDLSEKYFSLIERRISGEPLQYIIGKWPFMYGEFYVGEGVLIPRSDTETLVFSAIDYIKKNNVKVVFDLCAGSGCVGISVAKKFPDVQVFCIELSDVAFNYLERNIKLNAVKNVTAIKGDITKCFADFDLEKIDVLLSNPPYIETDEIKRLSIEVQKEPFMALDGGNDGYYFYDIIAENWLPCMRKGTFASFECGETQARVLAEKLNHLSAETEIHRDLNNIERVVSLIKK